LSKPVSIKRFIQAIRRLPTDKPVDDPRKWYKTQKQHWLGWLREYHGPGAYGRKTSQERDAKYAYNHIVEYKMLLWLIEAADVNQKLVKKAKSVVDDKKTLQANSAAIRRIVPWEMLANARWKK
jgi:hypothetical protein